MKKIIIFGAGEGSKELVEIIIKDINDEKPTWDIIGFIDPDKALKGKEIAGYKVLGAKYEDQPSGIYGASGLLDNHIRSKIIKKEIKKAGFLLASIIHPSVVYPSDFKHGDGLVLYPSVKISYNVKIGNGIIVNYNSILGHDLRIGDNTVIGPSVTLPGRCQIGSNCMIGAGVVFVPGIKVKDDVVIGAGTTVMNNVKEKTLLIDMPRKIMKPI